MNNNTHTFMKTTFTKDKNINKNNNNPSLKIKARNEDRIIFEDDFSSGTLDKWSIKFPSTEIINDGKYNILSLSNPGAGGLGTQIDKAVDDTAFVAVSFFVKFQTRDSVGKYRLQQAGYGTTDIDIPNDILQIGQWYNISFVSILPDTTGYEQPLNVFFYGGSESDSAVKTLYRDIKLTQLKTYKEILFNNDDWKNYFKTNSTIQYQRKGDILTMLTGPLLTKDSDSVVPVILLEGHDIIPASHKNSDGTGEQYFSYAFFVTSGSSEYKKLLAYTNLTGGGNTLPGLPVVLSGDGNFYVTAQFDVAVNGEQSDTEVTISFGAIDTDKNNTNNKVNVKRYVYLLGKDSIILES